MGSFMKLLPSLIIFVSLFFCPFARKYFLAKNSKGQYYLVQTAPSDFRGNNKKFPTLKKNANVGTGDYSLNIDTTSSATVASSVILDEDYLKRKPEESPTDKSEPELTTTAPVDTDILEDDYLISAKRKPEKPET